ncbi:glycerophosphodiester phosphodiesterase family protein [Parerythrobacter lacustris]|uniref:glycerophosphodiester phosphodiesterase n=1 Tax=Parerythrobacter lacustris TaxID=2969984 RepID=A0ABT1XS94_9SPHN|nr:glycerophosphodiester phosphodiesterase family protein [Parerythrobacter lacustris]MCR2834149.1 glycerophosphodiester phosphodiesterase [Parerythrobacter lacustris]
MTRIFLAALALAVATPALADTPIIIAHRGASGERPEHTLAAYELGIDQGADYIEPDLVVTKDGVLVARHETEISETTDVATREEFADRRRSKTVDGQLVNGFFAEDFTLAELRTLRAKERIPGLRPQNARYDGLYQIPTLEEIVRLVRAKEIEVERQIGIYPELKHSEFLLQEEGIDTVDLLLLELKRLGVTEEDPLFIQSFEVGPLQRLDQRSAFKLVQLVAAEGGPADEPAMRYAEMITPSGLAEIAAYADAIGANIGLLLDETGQATPLVADAQSAGLLVHAWTLRKENAFLPAALQLDGAPPGTGCDGSLFGMLVAAGVDGVFTDDPARVRAWPNENDRRCPVAGG